MLRVVVAAVAARDTIDRLLLKGCCQSHLSSVSYGEIHKEGSTRAKYSLANLSTQVLTDDARIHEAHDW